MKTLRDQFIELLNIHGTSGNEKPVRDYLLKELASLVDKMHVDEYGNLLAEKKIGTGKGSVVMLSAHMDTVKGVLANRELNIINDNVISSSKGALGADDRAGIAIALAVLRNIDQVKSFNGVIKVAFSREEEIGCIGSKEISEKWYSDVDLAIVIDRRGNRDIVVGCGMAFCSNAVGNFMEDVAELAGMNDWACVEGGISDAMTFSKKGINSINVSAGYRNEHTDKEWVSLYDMKDTVKLIMQALAVINNFSSTFGSVPSENDWVKLGRSYGKYYYEDDYLDESWAVGDEIYGDVLVYEFANEIAIHQEGNEILLNRDSLKSLIDQLKNI